MIPVIMELPGKKRTALTGPKFLEVDTRKKTDMDIEKGYSVLSTKQREYRSKSRKNALSSSFREYKSIKNTIQRITIDSRAILRFSRIFTCGYQMPFFYNDKAVVLSIRSKSNSRV